MAPTACVVKVGGSLLDFPALVPALREWLASWPMFPVVLVWGGGAWVDFVRELYQRYALDENETHWLAVRLLDVSARLGKLLLPEAEFCSDYAMLESLVRRSVRQSIIFSPEQFLQQVEPGLFQKRLPADWTVTSDSIAARLATALRAELVLLKAADPPQPAALEQLCRTGYVDAFFPHAVLPLQKVTVVNLRTGEQWVVPVEGSPSDHVAQPDDAGN